MNYEDPEQNWGCLGEEEERECHKPVEWREILYSGL